MITMITIIIMITMMTAVMKVMTAGQLARRLSVSTTVSELNTAGRSQDPGQRMPPNREVDLISKVGGARAGLQAGC